MRESSHHHIAAVLLNLAHLLELVSHARLIEQLLPLRVLLHLGGVHRQLP